MDKIISRRDTDGGKFRLRRHQDDEGDEEDWWFASTAIPLIAATVAPLANVLSIAALVVSWRMSLVPGGRENEHTWNGDPSVLVQELEGIPFGDPKWCYDLNAVSLACGFLGNIFLLANFTNRIRYIIALPASIIFWYIATGLLIGITASMNVYDAPQRPQETYTQGFWYGVIAAILYLICSMILMINMLGYFLGHYGQHFNLSESQRTLILQTMMFFIWLAGGAGIFSNVETTIGNQGWIFTDALYFCDVTILTVGFGDLYPDDDVGRGLVFPYTVGGTIMLGLVIGSLSKFSKEISANNVVRKRTDTTRKHTVERSQQAEMKYLEKTRDGRPSISSPFDARRSYSSKKEGQHSDLPPSSRGTLRRIAGQTNKIIVKAAPRPRRRRQSRAMLLKEEKDRFDAMRHIQHSTNVFKRYTALTISVIAFATLWCAGAAVFYATEKHTQNLTYFRALYFAYVSLLTIGYGDEAPKSNAGRPFFVVWSLLAVPTMTILVSDMGDTVIGSFQKGTSVLADFTILPKYGIWRNFLDRHPWLLWKLQHRAERKAAKKRIESGFEAGPDREEAERDVPAPTLDALAQEEITPPSESELARKLARTIRRTAQHLKDEKPRRYSYEEWVEITELIRFSSKKKRRTRNQAGESSEMERADEEEEVEEDLIEWDWIGENSPMMAVGKSEAEFVLDRLCESMIRYVKAQASKDS